MQIRESAEDYLEAILVLSRKGGGVRSVDIATMLGVSKPSVSHAMKLLREDGYIAMDRYGTVTLMEKGAEIANRIYERHTVLTKMLEGLGGSADTARCDACKVIMIRIENVTILKVMTFLAGKSLVFMKLQILSAAAVQE